MNEGNERRDLEHRLRALWEGPQELIDACSLDELRRLVASYEEAERMRQERGTIAGKWSGSFEVEK